MAQKTVVQIFDFCILKSPKIGFSSIIKTRIFDFSRLWCLRKVNLKKTNKKNKNKNKIN